MNKLKNSLKRFGYLESLAKLQSPIHNLNPLLKLLATFIIIIFVVTTKYYELIELLVYLMMIIIIIIISRLSFKEIFKRSLIGLPIALCMGVSNLLFSNSAVNFYGIYISSGIIMMIALVLKNIICLMIVLLLIATTEFESITCELVHIKVPSLFVLQLVMIYRYIFLLVNEAIIMLQSYQLKNPLVKGIAFKDAGSFIGTLLVRSMKRSNEVYEAMKCRGFDVNKAYLNYQVFESENYFLLMMMIGLLMIIKVVI